MIAGRADRAARPAVRVSAQWAPRDGVRTDRAPLPSGASPAEPAAVVHRVRWERLNDFWMLRRRYVRGDSCPDPQFAAASALVVWWSHRYPAVHAAFCR